MNILLATGNAHKKDEFSRILFPHHVLMPSDIGVEFDAEENGSSYLENALIKARTLLAATEGYWVIADDSGLSVPALNGEPGIHSARYGSAASGRILTSSDRNDLLLKNMKNMIFPDRNAFFVCCMVLMLDEYRMFSAQETFAGTIAETPQGSGGFGYDPVFFLHEYKRTFAELDAAEKDAISHRGRAGMRIRTLLNHIEQNP